MNNPLDLAFINFNKNYRRITEEGQHIIKQQPKLKNVTPKKIEFEQLEFNFDKEQQ